MRKASLALLRQRDFGLLWWGGLISFLGNWMLVVATPITVLELTGDPASVAQVIVARVIPSLLVGPFAGVLVDRWDRRRVMVVANLGLAAALLPLMFVHDGGDVWLVIVSVLATAAIGPFMGAAENALLPLVVTDEQLPSANSLNSLNNNLARLIGPAVGGAATIAFGLAGVAIADATTFLIAAAMIFAVRGKHRPERAASDAGVFRRFASELADGFRTIAHSRTLLVVFGFIGVFAIGEGIMATLFAPWVAEELGGGANEYGWLIAAQAVGGIIGGLLGGWFGARWSARILLGTGGMLAAVIDLLTLNSPRVVVSVIPGIVFMILVGLPWVLFSAAVMTLMQRATADSHRGRVFSTRGVVFAAFQLAGTGVAVALTERFGVLTVLNLEAVAIFVAALGAMMLLPRVEEKAEEPVRREEEETAAA